jgi:hypothetical protein
VYPLFVPAQTLFHALRDLDRQIADEARLSGCPRCGGPLHLSTWQRKPRGGPDLPDDCVTRWGLCCGSCRRRTLPRSVLFLGRHVYFKPVILLVVAARQRQLSRASIARLQQLFGAGRRTILRWLAAFLERLPRSADWQRTRGRVGADVRDRDVPAALLDVLLARDADPGGVLVRACGLVPAL